MISEFGENANSYCSFESKETALLHSENDSLQQRVNALTHEVRGPTTPRKLANVARACCRCLAAKKKAKNKKNKKRG